MALRENNDAPQWLLGDHLGSNSLTLNSAGGRVAELRYHPFGSTRSTEGTTPTERRYTGQIEDAGTGLYFYNARYYDPALGRFTQADTIVPEPGNPQALNRYSYTLNNPVKYTDPSGHDWRDAVQQFVEGAGEQLASNNLWMAPQAQKALAAKPNEGVAKTAGRVVGDSLTMVQGVLEFGFGGGVAGGGTVICGTGAGCVAGAPAVAAGTTVMAHGGVTATQGALSLGRNLGNLVQMSTGSSGGNSVSREVLQNLQGNNLHNIRSIDSGRLRGFMRGDTELNGGDVAARSLFNSLTGENAIGDFHRFILQDGREVVFRSSAKSGSNMPKIEIVDPSLKFLEKISFHP